MLSEFRELLKSKNFSQKSSLSLSLISTSSLKPLKVFMKKFRRACFRKNASYHHDWSHRKKGEIRYVKTTNYQVALHGWSTVL